MPPAALRRVVAPLAWLVLLLPPALVWAVVDVHEASQPLVPLDRAVPVQARVSERYGGGLEVPISYPNPETAQEVSTEVLVHEAARRPAAGATIAVVADGDDPDVVELPGDREPVWWGLADYALLPAVTVLVVLGRWLLARRLLRLLARDAPTFAMLGHVTEARASPQRRVHLYPLDAPTGARPQCTVPVLPWEHGAPGRGATVVEVKGSPRPFGLVVARIGDEVLWPVGPARTPYRVRRPDLRRGPAGAVDVHGARRPGPPPPVALPDPVSLLLGCLAAAALAVWVAVGTYLGWQAHTDALGTGERVVVEATAIGPDELSLDVRFRDASGATRTATAAAEWPEAYTIGRRYPAVVVGDTGQRVQLLAEHYDVVDPVVWGLVPLLVGGSLLVRHRVYAGPFRPTPPSAPDTPDHLPRRRRPRARHRAPVDLTSAAVAAAVATVAAALTWTITVDSWTKTEDMLRRGVRTTGVVVEVTSGRTSTLTAEYRTRDGLMVRADTVNFVSDYDVGDPVEVVYDPVHPRRMEAADYGTDHFTTYAVGAIASVATTAAVGAGGTACVLLVRRRRGAR